MFPSGYNPYAPYQPHDSHGLQQEFQRQRQAQEDAHRRELEEFNRLAAEREAEYVRRMAELQRRSEVLRRRKMELDVESKKLKESIRLGPQLGGLGLDHSMFGGGMRDILNTLNYGYPRPQPPPVPVAGQRSRPSAPQAAQERSSPVDPTMKPRSAAKAVSQFLTPKVRTHVDVVEVGQSTVPGTNEPAASGPTSRVAPTASAPKDTAKTAAETQQVDRSSSRKAIADILSKFAILKFGFTFPTTLDFLSSSTPKLAYTPNNAPLHQYEHLLTGLLTQLDAVESHGDAKVRKARKDAVREIEKELEELDGKKVREWKRQFEPASVTEPIPPDADTTQATSSTGGIGPQLLLSVDPASTPLPHDDDWGLQMDDIQEPPATSSESTALDAPTQLSLPHGDKELNMDVGPREPAAPSEFTERVVPPAPGSSPSPPNAEPTQDAPVQKLRVDIPTSEASIIEDDAAEDDYVNIPSAKISVVHPGIEQSDEGLVKVDWELDI